MPASAQAHTSAEDALAVERLTLRSVDVRPVAVPLRRPVVSKIGAFNEWPLILIDLLTEQGIVGRSYLGPYQKQAIKYIVPLIRDLAAARKGKPVRPLHDFQRDRRSFNLAGYEGVTMIAISGVDMAAWDALARAAGLPLAVFLGGALDPVPAYNSNGLWLRDVSALAAEAAALVAEGGFKALKLRLGRERLADDIAAIEAVRNAAGADIKLMVDFNQGLTLGEALQRCHALDDQGLYWFEEPIAYNDLRGCAQLARELATPIQLGENFYGPKELARAIALSACDYVMPDLMRIGGVSGWLRSAPIAAAAGIEVSTHLYPEISAHLLRVTETAHWLEWQDWADPIVAEPFALREGRLDIPDRPGHGMEWDEQAVEKFRLND